MSIFSDYGEYKTFNQPPEVDKLFEYLRHHFPGGDYRSVYEAGYCGFGSTTNSGRKESSVSWSTRRTSRRRIKSEGARGIGSIAVNWAGAQHSSSVLVFLSSRTCFGISILSRSPYYSSPHLVLSELCSAPSFASKLDGTYRNGYINIKEGF